MAALKLANLGLRFLLELATLAALAWWGARTGESTVAKWLLAITLPLIAAVGWGLFVSPKARFAVPGWLHLALQIVFFGGGALALASNGQPALAAALAVLAAVNLGLRAVWRQYGV